MKLLEAVWMWCGLVVFPCIALFSIGHFFYDWLMSDTLPAKTHRIILIITFAIVAGMEFRRACKKLKTKSQSG